MTTERNPAEDCTDQRCPFAFWPHSVELVPNTNVRMHYAADPEAMRIVLLWIHGDDEPWPDIEERDNIRQRHADKDTIRGKPWDQLGRDE